MKPGKPLKRKGGLVARTPLKTTKPLKAGGFLRQGAFVAKGQNKTKSGPQPVDPDIRFFRKVVQGEPSDCRPDLGPCLIFTGADNGHGYGQFSYHGPRRTGYAHRYAWERVHGPIPEGLTIDHLCRVRRCVELSHLELVDGPTNTRRGVAAWATCRSGEHERSEVNTYTWNGRKYCAPCRRKRAREAGVRKRNPPGTPDPRVRHDQTVVRAQIALVRAGEKRIVEAARTIGCNPNYLGRRIWRETKVDVKARDGQACCICRTVEDQLDVHHRRNRGAGGTSDPLISFGFANLMTLCRTCHDRVGVNPAAAREQGWAVPSTRNPAEVPVWLGGIGFAFLNTDGSITEAPEEEEVA
jgi:hypothetical protein